MKKIVKGGLLMLGGYLAYRKYQARKHDVSLTSKVYEDILSLEKTIKKYRNTEQKVIDSEEFTIPLKYRCLFGIYLAKNYNDTYELLPTKGAQDTLIFYLHGGAYWNNPLVYHYKFLREVSNKTGSRMIMPIYPKAPYHHIDEAVQMVHDRYINIINDEKINPKNVIIMGDSAGGGLALTLMMKIRDENRDLLPSQGILISPWLDVSMTNPKIRQYIKADKMLDLDKLKNIGEVFARPHHVQESIVSPIYGSLEHLPLINIFVGTNDLLYPDIERLDNIARVQNPLVKVHVYHKMMHVFPLVPMLPEAHKAKEKIYQLIQSR